MQSLAGLHSSRSPGAQPTSWSVGVRHAADPAGSSANSWISRCRRCQTTTYGSEADLSVSDSPAPACSPSRPDRQPQPDPGPSRRLQ